MQGVLKKEGIKGIIYKAVSPSGKMYIGQTVYSLECRKGQHIRSAINENSDTYNTKFHRAVRKHQDTLEWCVVAVCLLDEDLDEKERFYIKQFDSIKNGYNISEGGSGGNCLKWASPQSIKNHRDKARLNTKRWWSNASQKARQKRVRGLKLGTLAAKDRVRTLQESLSRSRSLKEWWSLHPEKKRERSERMMGNNHSKGKLSGERNGRSKLEAQDAIDIRRLYATSDYTQKQIGNLFGVSCSCVGSIVRGDTWKI